MKKKISLILMAVFVLALGFAAYAYTTSGVTEKAAMDCCCKGDSCPMSKKTESGETAAKSCCDMEDCCCKKGGDSCPMMKKDGTHAEHKAGGHEQNGEHANCSCCKDKAAA